MVAGGEGGRTGVVVAGGGGGGGGGLTVLVDGRMNTVVVLGLTVCTGDDVGWLVAPQSKVTRFPASAWPRIVLAWT